MPEQQIITYAELGDPTGGTSVRVSLNDVNTLRRARRLAADPRRRHPVHRPGQGGRRVAHRRGARRPHRAGDLVRRLVRAGLALLLRPHDRDHGPRAGVRAPRRPVRVVAGARAADPVVLGPAGRHAQLLPAGHHARSLGADHLRRRAGLALRRPRRGGRADRAADAGPARLDAPAGAAHRRRPAQHRRSDDRRAQRLTAGQPAVRQRLRPERRARHHRPVRAGPGTGRHRPDGRARSPTLGPLGQEESGYDLRSIGASLSGVRVARGHLHGHGPGGGADRVARRGGDDRHLRGRRPGRAALGLPRPHLGARPQQRARAGVPGRRRGRPRRWPCRGSPGAGSPS